MNGEKEVQKKEIHYTRYYANPDTRGIKAMDSVLYHTIFQHLTFRYLD